MDKKLTLPEVIKKIEIHRSRGETIALCDGFFNILHIGHIRYLKQAKNLSDVTIVSIVADADIDPQIGHSDHYNENDRAAALAELPYVDYVVVNPYPSLKALVQELKPTLLVEGPESNSNGSLPQKLNDAERMEFKKNGTDVVRVKEDDMVSTTKINRYIRSLPLDIRTYIDQFKKRFNRSELTAALEAMRNQKVLVVGDTIIDEYQYCTGIGKSSKDPTLAIKYESHDIFAGGVLAVANHLAGIARKVDLVTILGEKNSYVDFIQSKLLKNVSPQFLIRPQATTLIKRRFVEGYSMTKLLEVYEMDDSCLDGEINRKFNNLIFPKIAEYDVIVIADFGHGTINQGLKNALSELAPFLAVNAQSNAGNRGFNNISKYPRADYVSMAEHEIRLEMRDLDGRIQPMMKEILHRLHCDKIVVTRGRNGCMILDQDGEFYQVPSFVTNVIDRVGAGDALFAVTALSASAGIPTEVVAFLGNIAGTKAVEIMGNQKYISEDQMIDYIDKLYLAAENECVVNF